jgi:hypothetical protein
MTERTLLPPGHPQAPKYWMYEVGGKLVPAIKRYLEGTRPFPDDVNLIRAYLIQWIASPVWNGGVDDETRSDLTRLRSEVRTLRSTGEITKWLADALDIGIDPL